jgi:hypothetical protein
MMEFVDALAENAAKLVKSANELSGHIETLRSQGYTAGALTQELLNTWAEIGRLNAAIERQLERTTG